MRPRRPWVAEYLRLAEEGDRLNAKYAKADGTSEAPLAEMLPIARRIHQIGLELGIKSSALAEEFRDSYQFRRQELSPKAKADLRKKQRQKDR